MVISPKEIQWEGLFPRSTEDAELADFFALHTGNSVLITGAGGSIGSAISRAIAKLSPGRLILVDSSEQNLYDIHRHLSSSEQKAACVPVLGSVAEERCMRDVFVRFRPQIVYHSAALKHVPLSEMNPFPVIENNVFGTGNVAGLAHEFNAERLVMSSTDKSVAPESIMGASKRLAEIILQMRTNARSRMTSIRLGNVLASEGSVVPLFLEQIAHGGPVTVTDPNAERYFLTMDSTVLRVLASAADCPDYPAIAIPTLGKPVKIAELARYLISLNGPGNIQISYTGMRPGDKLREEFLAPGESVFRKTGNLLQWLRGPCASATCLGKCLDELRTALQERDLARLLTVLVEMVPEYRPSAYLRERLEAAVS